MRTSSPWARCSSGERATNASTSGTSPATQYGMPHAEYDVHDPRSSTTSSSSRPVRVAVRSACDAALMPAASPPMTTILSVTLRTVRPTT